MAILRFASAALCFMLFACMREPTLVELSEQNVVVHAVLIGGSDSAKVLITRPQTTSVFGGPIGVANADVRLVTAGLNMPLSAGGECFSMPGFPLGAPGTNTGCYVAAVPGGIVYGATYELEIVVPGRPAIRGSTRIPETPVIQSPAPNAEIVFSGQGNAGPTVEMTWSVGESDAPVFVHLAVDANDCALAFRVDEFGLVPYIAERGSRSILVVPLAWNCSQPPTRAAGEVVVTAFDENYDLYLRSFNTTIDRGQHRR